MYIQTFSSQIFDAYREQARLEKLRGLVSAISGSAASPYYPSKIAISSVMIVLSLLAMLASIVAYCALGRLVVMERAWYPASVGVRRDDTQTKFNRQILARGTTED